MIEPRDRAIGRRGVLVAATLGLAGCVSDLERLKEELTGERSQKRRVVETYEAGVEAYNRGVTDLERAAALERWSPASRKATESAEHLETAVAEFDDARRTAADLGNRQAREICAFAVETAELTLRAARTMNRAAQAFVNGNRERGSDHLSEYREYQAEARSRRMPRTDQVASALGLGG